MIHLLLVEDNPKLRAALRTGLEATGQVTVRYDCESGEKALEYCLASLSGESRIGSSSPDSGSRLIPSAALMDVQLAGKMNGIQSAVAIRRELPRFPVVFYSIQDDEIYYRDFQHSRVLSHYAYVRKSNYLLPQMILPLLKDAIAGKSFIDPEIEARVQEVRLKEEYDPMALLEPNEQTVARFLAQGLTNEQIAVRMGFHDKRTISRTNGQIYIAWDLSESATDEKVARTRAALIVRSGRLIHWDESGVTHILDERGEWIPWEL
jgi:DNA-binding NarL/FixJ family response regulator